MKLWLIEVVRNIDIFCNIYFWFSLPYVVVLTNGEPAEDRRRIAKMWFKSWILALAGVILIPSKAVMQSMWL